MNKQQHDFIDKAQGIHDHIAQELSDFGGLLRCSKCGYEQPLNNGQIGSYLSRGWPEHCGYTMSWITQRLLDQERTDPKPPA